MILRSLDAVIEIWSPKSTKIAKFNVISAETVLLPANSLTTGLSV